MTKTVTLGEICTILSGFAFDSELFSENEGMPLIRIRDIGKNQTNTFYSGSYSDRYIIEEGDMLIGMDGDFRIAEWKSVPALLNQRVCKLEPNIAKVHAKFLLHFLPKKLKEIEDTTSFATVKHLSVKGIQAISIPLPPIPEQRRIAALLDRADALRQKDRQLLAHYDKLTQSVFMDLFGDPVKNERGWEKVPFGEIGDSRLGKMLDAKQQTGANRFPYLGNSNVQWGRFKLDDLLEMDFSEKDRREFELRNGDLLICEGGEVGRTAIWREQIYNCYFQKALHRVRLNSRKASPEYMQALMWHLAKNNGLKDFTTVATIAHLTGVKLKSMPIIIPPLPLQTHFASVIEKIEQQKEVVRQQMVASEGLFGRLLQESFG